MIYLMIDKIATFEEREMTEKIYTAAVLIIGNEILSGRTLDKNTQYIAEKLNEHGVRLMEVRIVPDIESMVVHGVNRLREQYDYVFTTGGIGPTHDDITATCVAKAFCLPLTRHPKAYEIMLGYYGKDKLTDARLKMAMTPDGATLVPNPVSGAPGFNIENVYVLAGVPKIMQGMLDHIVLSLKGGAPVLSRTVEIRAQESEIANALGTLQDEYPDIDIGSYPQYSSEGPRVAVVLRGTDEVTLDDAVKAVEKI